jgi:NitT/TauT family transport system ATP-binding protein/sulfonate transport system ATP-binding protein
MTSQNVIMTPRPRRVEQISPIKLDRPRDRSSPNFLSLRSDILQTMHFAGRSLGENGA